MIRKYAKVQKQLCKITSVLYNKYKHANNGTEHNLQL